VIRKPALKTKIVDGTSLAVAAVLHMIPRGAKDVLLLGKESKVVVVLAQALCERDIQVWTTVLFRKNILCHGNSASVLASERRRRGLILQNTRSKIRSCKTKTISRIKPFNHLIWVEQVRVADENLFEALKQQLRTELQGHLVLSCSYSSKVD
jgi:hypothetical protein